MPNVNPVAPGADPSGEQPPITPSAPPVQETVAQPPLTPTGAVPSVSQLGGRLPENLPTPPSRTTKEHFEQVGRGITQMMHSLYQTAGSRPAYKVDEQGRVVKDTEAESAKATPGNFFRNILAGALIGLGAGAEAHARSPWMSPIGGLGIGAKAGMGLREAEDVQARERAKEDFERQRQAKRDKAELQEMEVLTASHNANRMKTAMEISGMSHTIQSAIVQEQSKFLDMIHRAGGQVATDSKWGRLNHVTESMHQKMLDEDPEIYKKYAFIEAGTDKHLSKDGYEQFETYYEAIKPDQPVTVTLLKDELQILKDAGANSVYSHFDEVMGNRKEMPLKEFIALKQSIDAAATEITGIKKVTLENEKIKAEAAELMDRDALYKLQKRLVGKEITKNEQVETASQSLQKKLDELRKTNPDADFYDAFGQINIQDQMALHGDLEKTMEVLLREYDGLVREAKANADPLGRPPKEVENKINDTLKDIDKIRALLSHTGVTVHDSLRGPIQDFIKATEGMSPEDRRKNFESIKAKLAGADDPVSAALVLKGITERFPDLQEGAITPTPQPQPSRYIGPPTGKPVEKVPYETSH